MNAEETVNLIQHTKLVIDEVFDIMGDNEVNYHIVDHILPYLIEETCKITSKKCNDTLMNLNNEVQLLPELEIYARDSITLADLSRKVKYACNVHLDETDITIFLHQFEDTPGHYIRQMFSQMSGRLNSLTLECGISQVR